MSLRRAKKAKSISFHHNPTKKDIMMNIRSRLENIQHINRNVLLHHDARHYSETTLNMQRDIDSVLLMWDCLSGNGEEEDQHLWWLQIQLYNFGVCLLHHEADPNSHLTLDYALRYFNEALELGYEIFQTSEHISTVAPLNQIGLVFKQKGFYSDSFATLALTYDIACQLDDVVGDASLLSAIKYGTLKTMGDIQYETGNLNQALVLYKHATVFFELGEIDNDGFEGMLKLLQTVGVLSQRIHGANSADTTEYLELARFLSEVNTSEGTSADDDRDN